MDPLWTTWNNCYGFFKCLEISLFRFWWLFLLNKSSYVKLLSACCLSFYKYQDRDWIIRDYDWSSQYWFWHWSFISFYYFFFFCDLDFLLVWFDSSLYLFGSFFVWFVSLQIIFHLIWLFLSSLSILTSFYVWLSLYIGSSVWFFIFL